MSVDKDFNKDYEDSNLHTSKHNKAMSVKSIPDNYAGATPNLYVNLASAALEFYQTAFGAKVLVIIKDNKSRIVYSEILIGRARIILSDEFPEINCYSPRHLGGATSGVTLFFEDSDKIFNQAIAAGAQEISPVEDLFCGDRGGKILDPFGHHWSINTRKEDISYEEMKLRGEKFYRKH